MYISLYGRVATRPTLFWTVNSSLASIFNDLTCRSFSCFSVRRHLPQQRQLSLTFLPSFRTRTNYPLAEVLHFLNSFILPRVVKEKEKKGTDRWKDAPLANRAEARQVLHLTMTMLVCVCVFRCRPKHWWVSSSSSILLFSWPKRTW